MMKRVLRIIVCLFCILSLFVISALAYSDVSPTDSPFTGSLYISGDTLELGYVNVYIPVNYRTGYLGLDSSGNLFNVSSSSITGVLYSGSIEYTFRLASWSTPQYRSITGTGTNTYYDLTFTSIDYSNAEIADEFPSLVSPSDVLEYVPIIFLGVIVLCLFMKRF